MSIKRGKLLLFVSFWCIAFSSCYKKDIQFGTDMGETYTQLIQVDTVGVHMSTVLLDSFETTAPTSFLLGRYKDNVFGIVTAKPFFLVGLPSDITIEAGILYDSLVFYCKPNQYYYGDTAKSVSISVNELAADVEYSYSDAFYNTSYIQEKTTPLGTRTMQLSPVKDTMITIRLSDVKGLELFNKLVQKSDDMLSSDAFLNYFKGISLGVGSNDSTVIYGIKAASDGIAMRLYYHTTNPYPEQHYKDFSFQSNNKYFNQVLTNRSNTLLAGAGSGGVSEIQATATANQAFSQTATGTLLKLTFPTLREILKITSNLQLTKATLVIKVAEGSYSVDKLKLPQAFYLAQTDGSNSVGSYIVDSTGASVLYRSPVFDHIYNTNATYTFDVTSAIKSYLATAGSAEKGFFLLEGTPQSGEQVNRAIINAVGNGSASSQLILSVVTIKN